jgi:interferon-induced GTP-binding protein Mx1
MSGIEFPADDQLCTRCPIQLRLMRVSHKLVRMHLVRRHTGEQTPPKTFSPDAHSEIAEELNRLMNLSIEGKDAMISDDYVVIENFSPTVPNLTLIDLPGLVRVTFDQKTEENTIRNVRSIIDFYIKQPRTVILAVLPANVDLANQVRFFLFFFFFFAVGEKPFDCNADRHHTAILISLPWLGNLASGKGGRSFR